MEYSSNQRQQTIDLVISIFSKTLRRNQHTRFSEIAKPNTDPLEYVISDYDVNQNETPRGGIVVSLGSTTGLGFAPLVGAAITATLSGAGAITGITTGLPGGSFGSGYNGLTAIGVTVTDSTQDAGGDAAIITATVGAGGTLSFSIGAGGTGYNNPQISVSAPTYENLSVTGVSRLSVGSTTDVGIGLSISLKVGNVVTTGIGSTHYGVTEFDITKHGYAFRRGDVIKPVGLVTDARLASPIHEFELTVLETYSDKFASWEFGELDFIDSIKDFQDGSRISFPLFFNGSLLSFEQPEDSRTPLENRLLIFINGILQEPGVAPNLKEEHLSYSQQHHRQRMIFQSSSTRDRCRYPVVANVAEQSRRRYCSGF